MINVEYQDKIRPLLHFTKYFNISFSESIGNLSISLKKKKNIKYFN